MSSAQIGGLLLLPLRLPRLELHLLTSPLLLAADLEKGKDTSVLGNDVEEDVEKDGQGWLLG